MDTILKYPIEQAGNLSEQESLNLIFAFEKLNGKLKFGEEKIDFSKIINVRKLSNIFHYFLINLSKFSEENIRVLWNIFDSSLIYHITNKINEIILLLEQNTQIFSSVNLSEVYPRIYKKYLETYFEYKSSGNTEFLIQDDKDKERINLIIEDKIDEFVKDKFNPDVIYTDLPFHKKDLAKVNSLKSPDNMFVVCNNEGYIDLELNKYNDQLIQGTLLKLSEDKPSTIGYNIHVPPNPRAIVVHVYGGHGGPLDEERVKKQAFNPNSLTDFDKALLNQGIVIITLNLADLKELRSINASLMPEMLHTKIHASINRFYEVITANPESLQVKLSPLKNLPIFLYGASFGGRTSIKHSELYPETFNGYISHDGVLSYQMAGQTDRPLTTRLIDIRRAENSNTQDSELQKGANEFLNPMFGINNIKRPLLLLHNYDDNNVNIQVTLDFYREAIKLGKVVKLFITPEGQFFFRES